MEVLSLLSDGKDVKIGKLYIKEFQKLEITSQKKTKG